MNRQLIEQTGMVILALLGGYTVVSQSPLVALVTTMLGIVMIFWVLTAGFTTTTPK